LSGSRIDYILASEGLLDSLTGADISANVIGSDHCPVWATLRLGAVKDSMSSKTDDLSLNSSITDRTPLSQPPRLCTRYMSHVVPSQSIRSLFNNVPGHIVLRSADTHQAKIPPPSIDKSAKRETNDSKQSPSRKKQKLSRTVKGPSKDPSPGQRSMADFFKTQTQTATDARSQSESLESESDAVEPISADVEAFIAEASESKATQDVSKSQWTSIFTKKGPPLCDAHGLPCIELVTKKPGPNLGRRFWICSKPVGPGYDNGKSSTLTCFDLIV
jgi:AP endonuclease 2